MCIGNHGHILQLLQLRDKKDGGRPLAPAHATSLRQTRESCPQALTWSRERACICKRKNILVQERTQSFPHYAWKTKASLTISGVNVYRSNASVLFWLQSCLDQPQQMLPPEDIWGARTHYQMQVIECSRVNKEGFFNQVKSVIKG